MIFFLSIFKNQQKKEARSLTLTYCFGVSLDDKLKLRFAFASSVASFVEALPIVLWACFYETCS